MPRFYFIILILFCSLSSFTVQEGKFSAVLVLNKHVNKEFKQGYRLDIAYPEVKHLYLKSTHHVNLFLQRIVWKAVADFRTKLSKTNAIDQEMGQLHLSYQVYHKSSDLISIKFTQRSKVPGEQEFSQRQTTFNFDFLLNQKLSELSDVFEEKADYSSRIADFLQANYACKVTAAQVEKYAHCCISDTGLVLSFPTSPDYADKEYTLPWSEVSGMLSNKTTVAALASGH